MFSGVDQHRNLIIDMSGGAAYAILFQTLQAPAEVSVRLRRALPSPDRRRDIWLAYPHVRFFLAALSPLKASIGPGTGSENTNPSPSAPSSWPLGGASTTRQPE